MLNLGLSRPELHHRDLIGERFRRRPGIDGIQSHRLKGLEWRSIQVRKGEISFSCLHANMRTQHLDFDVPKASVAVGGDWRGCHLRMSAKVFQEPLPNGGALRAFPR